VGYPWYAAWDLAFHTVALSMVDTEFAKDQLNLMVSENYLHPSGQLPAYEWNFGDVNPPVHAWATRYTYEIEKARPGHGDLSFLEAQFHKLALNFTWWVNRKDPRGNNDTGMFGGNSNWRGPIWMPVNVLIIRSLLNLYQYYGDDFRIECPTGSGRQMNLFEVAQEISTRLIRIFLRDGDRRPVYGGTEKFQKDPHWRDLILFYEYFLGDNGAGIGASHQTGWTGMVANLIQLFGFLKGADVLAGDFRKFTYSKERDLVHG
jgi:hypothetical protein